MMSEAAALIAEIKAFAYLTGMAPSTVCRRAVGNDKLYRRLKAGHSTTFDTAARLRAFIAANQDLRNSRLRGAEQERAA